jgi:acyl-CoA oxidase
MALRSRAESCLSDPEFMMRLFRFRERALLWGAARYLQSAEGRASGADYQTPLARFSRAQAERIALEQFSMQVQRSPASVRPVLASLCDLYATTCLADHLSWYLQEKVITGADARHIDRRITHLCNHIRPHAVSLVDSFGIPDECLAAPIACAANF